MATPSKRDYIKSVKEKLRIAAPLLRTGGMNFAGAPEVRDDAGLEFTFANILQVAENHYDNSAGRDQIASMITNFAGGGPGYSDASSVETIGAIDVTILAMSQSILPFLCIDRGMPTPTATIFWENLVAINAAGGVSANDVVFNNFAPLNTSVDLSMMTATASGTGTGADLVLTVVSGGRLIPGSVVVTLGTGPSAIVGKDFEKDGVVHFSGSALVCTANYDAGTVTVASCTNALAVSVTARPDSSFTAAGAGVLKVKAQEEYLTLTTLPNEIQYQESAFQSLRMQRIASSAGGIIGVDRRAVHFSRIVDIFTDYLSRAAIKLLIAATTGGIAVTLDLSDYDVASSFADTRRDQVSRFVIQMKTKFRQTTSLTPTVIVTGSRGAAEIEADPVRFVKNPNFDRQLNGICGIYDGTPVYRSNYVDLVDYNADNTGKTANFYMGYKSPDNNSGTIVYGEFLPIAQTPLIGNYQQPTQNATAFYSQSGMKVVKSTLAVQGTITLP